jgi:hypothetical protein
MRGDDIQQHNNTTCSATAFLLLHAVGKTSARSRRSGGIDVAAVLAVDFGEAAVECLQWAVWPPSDRGDHLP